MARWNVTVWVTYLEFSCQLLVLQSQSRNLGLQSGNQSRRRRQAVFNLSTHTHTLAGEQSGEEDHSLAGGKQNELGHVHALRLALPKECPG